MKNYWFKSAFYTIGERMLSLLFGFGSIYLLLRNLTKEDFGTWALFLTVSTLIEVARTGFIQSALIKFLSVAKGKEYAEMITASSILNIILSLCSVYFLLMTASSFSLIWHIPDLESMLYIYAITTILLFPFSQCNSIQQANLDFNGVFWSNLSRQAVLFFFIATLYFLNYKINIIHLAVYQLIAAFFGSLVAFILTKKYIFWSKNISWKKVKQLFDYGKYVFATNISVVLYKNIDRIMLGTLSVSAVAIYDLAIRINNLMEVPVAAMASIVFPQTAQKMENDGKKGVKKIYENSVAAVLCLIMPAILIIELFPHQIIYFIAGKAYLDTVPILRITALYGFFVPFARQFGTVFDAIGKPQISFYFVVLGALLNLAFNYILIMKLGILGAAYATLITLFLIFLGHQTYLYKHLNVSLKQIFIQMFYFYVKFISIVKKYKNQ
ncbi:MAG: flippase [Chitinophagales bacterium]